MRKHFFQPLLLMACLLTSAPLVAQFYWLGGAPGAETEWNDPRNWSHYRVPGPDDHVVITDIDARGGCYPNIDQPVAPIAHLRIKGNAQLTIASGGKLTVDGSQTTNFGLYLVGDLYNEGELLIVKTGLPALGGHPDRIHGYGSLLVIDEEDRVISLGETPRP